MTGRLRTRRRPALYDRIGVGYGDLRRPDPRIAAEVDAALGTARSVVNVGAGAGSYEPASRRVVPIELSRTMIDQRSPEHARAVRACASALPLRDAAVDAGLAVLTLHHWAEQARGLDELMRVTRGPVVLVTWDPTCSLGWLTDYFPEIPEMDGLIFPTMEALRVRLGEIEVSALRVPHDCTDGFLCAYWRRPAAYLDPAVRAAISTFSKLSDLAPRLARLAADIESGEWARRNEAILDAQSLDLGYRLVVARSQSAGTHTRPRASEARERRELQRDPEGGRG